MTYLIRLGVSALAILCLGAVLLMVTTKSEALEHILYDDLTCDELLHSYDFNLNVMQDIVSYYDGCVAYTDEALDGNPHHKLTCEYIKEHALFVQGIVNDVAAVYNIKCADE